MRITVHFDVQIMHLVWAVAYIMHRRYRENNFKRPNKTEVKDFLKSQMEQFGADYTSLMGIEWEDDFARTLPLAKKHVCRLFPALAAAEGLNAEGEFVQ